MRNDNSVRLLAVAGALAIVASPSRGDDDPSPPAAPAAPWHETLTGEVRQNRSVAHYVEKNDLPGLVTAFVNAERRIGERPLSVPGSQATDEEWGAVYQALGRPEKADAYEIRLPEGYEASELEKEAHPKIKQAFHKAGFTTRQADTFMEAWNDIAAGINTQLTAVEVAAHADGEAQIARLYPDRKAFDGDQRAGLHFIGGNDGDFLEAMQQLRLSTGAKVMEHPSFRIALARVGAALSEDQRGGAGNVSPHRYQSVENVDAEIAKANDRMVNDKTYPLHPEYKGDPAHVQPARDDRTKLYALRAQKRNAA